MADANDLINMSPTDLSDIGADIYYDAQDQISFLNAQWDSLHDFCSALPDCLKNDCFGNYEDNNKSWLLYILQVRQNIGGTLSNSADLMQFQDKLGFSILAGGNYSRSANKMRKRRF